MMKRLARNKKTAGAVSPKTGSLEGIVSRSIKNG